MVETVIEEITLPRETIDLVQRQTQLALYDLVDTDTVRDLGPVC